MIGVWLPTAAGFGLLTWNMHEETTAATRRQVEEYALRVGTTIERELDQRATLARTLAATHAAQEGDFARFHQEARAATAGLNAWVLVVDPAMQLLNTRAPYTGNRVRRAKPLPLTEGPPDIVFVPHARSGFVQREREVYDSFGRRQVVPERTYMERKGFILTPTFIFIDGRTGEQLHRETFREEILYNAQQNTPALSSYFELMDKLIPGFLSTLSTQKIRGSRVLLK